MAKVRYDQEVKGGMKISYDIPITLSDGTVLQADVFQPIKEGPFPVIMSYGCYAKGLSFQEAYKGQWDVMTRDFPGIMDDSTNKYQCWEVVDPELWVTDDYVVIRIDSRGAGRSEGTQNLWSAQEIDDYYQCIEWAAAQNFSNGNVGLHGISYYGANQWHVAAKQPPSLKAIIPWEGTSDWYREVFYHGGIRSGFVDRWLPRQANMQYGYGDRGLKNPNTGINIAGDISLTDEELKANIVDTVSEVKSHPLRDEFYEVTAGDPSKVEVPLLSAANWGGQGLHLRGNIEGFTQAASKNKWLEVHGLEHWTHYYTPYGVDLQKRFFAHFLKNEENGWDKEPPVKLQVRIVQQGDKGSTAGHFVARSENEWPLARTNWEKCYLDATDASLKSDIPNNNDAYLEYDPLESSGVTFHGPAVTQETEVTGPLAAKLFISSDTKDADIFLVVRIFGPDGEVVFRGAMDIHTPPGQGWLRASHRALDNERTLPYRPYHSHESREYLTPGEIYELDVEIWPTCFVLPEGYHVALSVRGTDFEYEGEMDPTDKTHRYPSRGVGPFVHIDPTDRPKELVGGQVKVHTGKNYPSYLLLPVIPAK